MSEICEHPLCTRVISAICSNHCQLDLCEEHIIEHRNLFLVQYEKSFNNLSDSLNELINSVEEAKKNLENNYQKDISIINENHNNKLNGLEQEFLLVSSTQKLIKKKLQLLTDVKNGQAFLYQYDIEQIKLYLTTLREYHHDKITIETNKHDIETSSSFNFNTDSDVYCAHATNANTKYDEISYHRGQCPLTRLGIYGLTDKHKLRLCSSEKKTPDLYLLNHFHRYHHLTNKLSYTLTKAIINKLNPLTTCIFQSETDIIDQHYHLIRCPLSKMESINCRRPLFKRSLKKHLLQVHHLTLKTCNKMLETIQKKDDITEHAFNENEFI
ncbi:unnamed protein product [Rotaria sp. Silwood1]|nr:unnamed protein product [Rotaria sp. Silwood1]CAF3352162.1 unnamed protein product [Rotaria sp. Silwood1]CAF4770487.1 unnamed protein product [Rotaria sp. Silwood1]